MGHECHCCLKVFIPAAPLPVSVKGQQLTQLPNNDDDMTFQTKWFYLSFFHAISYIHYALSSLCRDLLHTLCRQPYRK
jgi:hypothetical protein